jgi:hypothetical protein
MSVVDEAFCSAGTRSAMIMVVLKRYCNAER